MSNAALKISTSAPAEVKITAEQIERNCPVRLLEIGKEIGERYKKAQTGYKKADDHIDAIEALMEEAKWLCDEGGFRKFRERICPQLSKSRAYELLAIARNKRSAEETRAITRKRVAKHRAKKAATSNSVTVTETMEQVASSAPAKDDRFAGGALLAQAQTPQPAKVLSIGAIEALMDFCAKAKELIRMTHKRQVKSFVKAPVEADALAKLGKFLSDLANLKKSRAVAVEPERPGCQTMRGTGA